MAPINIEFEWTRAFPRNPAQSAYEFVDGKIQQTGRGREKYNPFELAEPHLEFAGLDGSPERCVRFANKFGLLTVPANVTSPPSEDLAFWRREIRKMQGSVRMLPHVVRVGKSSETVARVGAVEVWLVPGPAGPILKLKPGSLLQAMNLSLAQSIAGGALLMTCRNCGRWFEAKRSDAKFCSDYCRSRHYYAHNG
jgi:hypothetical protein